MKKLFITLLPLLLIACAPKQVPVTHSLFVTTPTSEHPYRIPSLVEASNGDLIAISDYRYGGGDIGSGRIDLHARRSIDHGTTWGEEYVMVKGTGAEGFDCAHGDAATVTDIETGEILLLAASGHISYWDSRHTRPQFVGRYYSSDNGKTFSAGDDITEQIYSIFRTSTLDTIQALFVASGHICQSRQIKVGSHHRIYAALCVRPGGNRVIYSDDFGHTWSSLGDVNISPVPLGDEPKCEELPNGNVLISSRMHGGRYFNIFTYSNAVTAEGVWGSVVASDTTNQGTIAVNNACNGEILVLPVIRTADNKTTYIALQSVPFGPKRSHVGIYYKELASESDYATPTAFATGWTPYLVSDMGSAYSTMLRQKDNSIGFLYEEETDGAWYTIVYKRLYLEQITNGAYHIQ